jgi:hypothetical protein
VAVFYRLEAGGVRHDDGQAARHRLDLRDVEAFGFGRGDEHRRASEVLERVLLETDEPHPLAHSEVLREVHEPGAHRTLAYQDQMNRDLPGHSGERTKQSRLVLVREHVADGDDDVGIRRGEGRFVQRLAGQREDGIVHRRQGDDRDLARVDAQVRHEVVGHDIRRGHDVACEPVREPRDHLS